MKVKPSPPQREPAQSEFILWRLTIRGRSGRRIAVPTVWFPSCVTIAATGAPLRAAIEELLAAPSEQTQAGRRLSNFWSSERTRNLRLRAWRLAAEAWRPSDSRSRGGGRNMRRAANHIANRSDRQTVSHRETGQSFHRRRSVKTSHLLSDHQAHLRFIRELKMKCLAKSFQCLLCLQFAPPQIRRRPRRPLSRKGRLRRERS